jgi:hypothetical protein
VLFQITPGLWFFKDEWEFFARRVGDDPPLGLWAPHNEHWSTIPILVYRVLFDLVGLRTYTPYMAVLIAMHLAVAHVLWRVCLRVGAGPAAATAGAAIMALLGAGAENLLWAFQIGFVGSVLATWAHALLVDHDGSWGRRDAAGWAAGIFALMSSGLGVPLLVVPVVTAWLRRGLRAALMTGAVPAVTFAGWYLKYGEAPGELEIPGTETGNPSVAAILRYTGTGLDKAATAVVGLPWAGAALVVVLAVAIAARLLPWRGRAAMSTAGLVALVPFYVFLALGRARLGVAQAEAPRYIYAAFPLVVPALALLATHLIRRARYIAGPVLLVCALAVLGHNLAVLRQAADSWHARGHESRTRVLAAVALTRTGEPVIDFRAGAPRQGFSTFLAIKRLSAAGAFPTAQVPPTDVANARLLAQVAITPGARHPDAQPLRVVAAPGTTLRAARPGSSAGCVRATRPGARPVLLITTSSGPGELTLFPGRSATIAARWQDGQVSSTDRLQLRATKGRPVTFTYLAAAGQLVLETPGGRQNIICGIARPFRPASRR